MRRHISDEVVDLVRGALNLMEEISRQPRIIGRKEGRTLYLRPYNESGVGLVRIIAEWLNSPRDLSGMKPLDEFAVTLTYPPTYDGDIGEASGDRRDPERAGSAVEGEGIGEEYLNFDQWRERWSRQQASD